MFSRCQDHMAKYLSSQIPRPPPFGPVSSEEEELEAQISIEISPGSFANLRGVREILDCVENDRYETTTCFACALQLCCIDSVEYVICPTCKVVGPFVRGATAGESEVPRVGVGLGFTVEQLQGLQNDILRNQGSFYRFRMLVDRSPSAERIRLPFN